ncbi:MAG: hypothetical protein ACP5UO_01190 [Thermoplasmata archaeon]
MFKVEKYPRYKGDSFIRRFDANSYLYLTKAIDAFDVHEEDLRNLRGTRVLAISFTSDRLYPSSQVSAIADAAAEAGATTDHVEIDSEYGHDSFLLDFEKESREISSFLEKVADENSIHYS